MAGYADELSLKLSAKDEMSARLKDVKKELTAVEKQMIDTRREFERTGAPEAAREYQRLQTQYESLSRSQRELAKSSSQVKRDLDQIRAKAGQTTSAMARLGTSIENHAQKIQRTGLVMGAALALFSRGALQQFSRVEDSSSALSATFEAQGAAMIEWAKKSGDALNLSQADALDALMTFSGYAKSAGLQGEELASFSEQLVARTADLASYYGGTTADAISAIGSALRGEAEPARRYQIFVDDAAMKAEYFAQTGEKVNGTLTAQQKVLAASALIMKQSSVAQGDLARTADSTANSLKDASQQWADFQASMGETVAQGVTPFLREGNKVLGMLSGLPKPVQQAAFAFTALGIAAMIATPRLIAFNAALKGIGVSVAALGPIAAILIGGTVAMLEAKDAGEKFNTGEKDLTETMTEHSGVLGFVSVGYANLVSVIGRVTGATQDVVSVTRKSAQVTTVSAVAAERAAGATQTLAAAHRSAAAAADIQTYAQKRLSGALGRAELLLARRSAMRAYRQSMTDFIAKPSAEAGDAVSAAMLNVANTYKDPEKRAKFVKRSYEDLEGAVKGSNLPKNIARKVTTPLHEAYLEARLLLNTMQQIDVINGTTAGNAPYSPIRRAAGGAVFGPGSGTSDSIPAMLSNGEYVIREAAARAIGYDQLDRLNIADRMPSLPAIVNAPAITISNPGGIGRDAPLIAQANFYPTGQVDLELALAREARRQDRDQRTRYAGSGRR